MLRGEDEDEVEDDNEDEDEDEDEVFSSRLPIFLFLAAHFTACPLAAWLLWRPFACVVEGGGDSYGSDGSDGDVLALRLPQQV